MSELFTRLAGCAKMELLTRPGFDRDDLPVLSSDALSGPGRVSNDLGTRRGFVVAKHGYLGTPEERFWRKVNKTETCWLWTGSLKAAGYGRLRVGEAYVGAHRYSYELHVGPIPAGLQLDHLCRTPACVNPAHLEPVSCRENVRRGVSPAAVNARREECLHGHALSGYNLIWEGTHRLCRICANAKQRRRTAQKKVREVPEGMHGTEVSYSYRRCRCLECRAAHAAKARADATHARQRAVG